jgi:hypothetical protein
VIHVTTANRSRRNSMSENATDSPNAIKPTPDTAIPKGARKPAKKVARAKKAAATQPHTVRGSPASSVARGEKIESSKKRRGRTDVQDREIASGNSASKRRLGLAPGAAFPLSGVNK